MGSWRNWLAQESYTFKVAGSSPALPTKSNTSTGLKSRS